MKQENWFVIGLMSGTSLDGVDLVYVHFSRKKIINFDIIASSTVPYNTYWKNQLTNAFTKDAADIQSLDVSYGKYLGDLVNAFIKQNIIEKIDFVASHGHTIFHKPEEVFTLQIGDGKSLAETCQMKIICDFRSQDVALGGQGAPLVPIGDALLFPEYDYCLNIGGFANISFDQNGIRKAYDICPANIVLNHYTRKTNLEFDDKGSIANSGNLNLKLLEALNTLPSYSNKKSLGNEIVQKEFIPLIDSFNLSLKDILHTYIEHFSIKIAEEIKANTSTLVTGGGAFNSYLIERISRHSNSRLIIPENNLINYKEALIFGLLGLLRNENEINCLASVTKATKNHSSGAIFTP